MRLKDKVTLITGGAKGIGRATALLFAREGAKIAIGDIDKANGSASVESIVAEGGDAMLTVGDVGLADDAAHMVAETVEHYGKIDVLMNNAAIMAHGTVVETSEELWDRVLRTNLKSVYLMCKYTIPHMLAGGSGRIVNVSSGAGITAWYGQAAYDAAKAAVVNLSRQMALDYARQGIRVNCLVPAIVDTDQLRGAIAQLPDPTGALESMQTRVPLGRLGTAEEIAYGALFLASDESSYAVGSALILDGGYLAS